MNKRDIVGIAHKRWLKVNTAESEQRDLSLKDMKLENGEHWTDQEKTDRTGRPCIVINKVAGVVKQIVGDMRQNRPMIKVRPVDSQSDIKIANILNGIIKNIENVSDAESAYDCGIESAVRCGIGFWRVNTVQPRDDSFDQEIELARITNPLSVYYDPSCVKTDFTDAKWLFVTEVVDKEDFEDEYPNASNSWDSTFGDDQADWFTDDGVRICEYWWMEEAEKHIFQLVDGRVIEVENAETMPVTDPMSGQIVNVVMGDGLEPVPYLKDKKVPYNKVKWCKLSGSEVLEGPFDWVGKYFPIIPCLGEEVWVNGKREFRSAIRHAHDPQRLYNWARSNAVETLALAPKQPYILTQGMVKGFEKMWNEAYSKPMPYLLINDGYGDPKRLTGSIADSGATQEAMLAADDIKSTTGLFSASLGQEGNETSGRAILARQREGDTATFVFSDNQTRAIKHTGKVLIDLIPKIYDAERVVRLLNDEGKESWERINIQMGGQTFTDLSIGRYDVVVDAGPGYMTRRMEAAEGMLQIMNTVPELAMTLVPKIARNLDWPDADKLADELDQLQAMQAQNADLQKKLDMANFQLNAASQQAKTEKTQAETEETKANIAEKIVSIQ